MPRRKYGRLQKPISPPPPEKCRACRLGLPCPIHDKNYGANAVVQDRKKMRREAKKKKKSRRL